MKIKIELITSILAFVFPICSVIIMCVVEEETIEAVFGGLLIGCLIGSVLGIVSLLINKDKSKLVKIFSIIPMFPLIIYVLLMIPYLMYN